MPLNDVRSVHLPYTLHRLDDGRYAVLNRERLPIGYHDRDLAPPIESVAVKIKGLTPTLAKKLSISKNDTPDAIHLYDDGCIPTSNLQSMTKYMKRLNKLAQLSIVR